MNTNIIFEKQLINFKIFNCIFFLKFLKYPEYGHIKYVLWFLIGKLNFNFSFSYESVNK